MLEAVIFDFGGVILDSEPLHYEACLKVLQPFEINFTYQEYVEKYLGLSDKEMFPKLFHDLNVWL
jgi:beta-phosphoglucomutase